MKESTSRFYRQLIIMLFFAGCFANAYADNGLMLSGRVKDAISKIDLHRSTLYLYDSEGNLCDSTKADKGYYHRGQGEVDTMSVFYFSVPRKAATYTIDIKCPGYQTQTISYVIDKVRRFDQSRDIPTIYMIRAPRMLDEVTVVSSKIKFYNKGDTLVFNADAFQLAEGSMLDALIAQLPGAELNENGQIKVNGQFVESLLLNGKQFFDGNNNIMLENISAYTVKNIQVYEAQSVEAQKRMDFSAPKVLTMDVRLKKEFNNGLLLNAVAGYGTENRYLGKVFASWFSPTSRVSFVGNVNNLNDNRTPGRNDTWTPEKMPSGTKSTVMAGLEYNHENKDDTRDGNGEFQFEQTIDNAITTTSRTNFLPGGNTFDYSIGKNRTRETRLSTNHYFGMRNNLLSVGINVDGGYQNSKNVNSNLSATLNKEQPGSTAEILDAIYSDGSVEKLDDVLNRSKTQTDGWRKSWSGNVRPFMRYRLPGRDNDYITMDFFASYNSAKMERWRDLDIHYGNSTAAAQKLRQFTDNSPNHTFNIGGYLGFRTFINYVNLDIRYKYEYTENVADSYMYALNRLEDMGVYGVLPENYLDAFDPANSFTSTLKTYNQSIRPQLSYHNRNDKGFIILSLNPEISFKKRMLEYERNNRNYNLTKYNTDVTIQDIWSGMIEYQFGVITSNNRPRFRNSMRYSYRIAPKLPAMTDMIDIVNDADPLNIFVGNPNLKKEVTHRHLFRWAYEPALHTFNNYFYLGFTHSSNALTRGYTYDTNTGVRISKMYNVKGGHSAAITNELSWQFGGKKQFTLSSETDVIFSTYTDMIGVNNTEPSFSKVNYRSLNEKLNLSWQLGKQRLSVRGDVINRHTTSKREGFNTLNAYHYNYGVSGVFNIPGGFGISTDFMLYTRNGYGSSNLDTTDPVWNMRLTYCPPRHNRVVVMLDGFDLLHKLSNVNYAVTASGRTVSYTNALPRYVLLSVQYRLNIQPKNK